MDDFVMPEQWGTDYLLNEARVSLKEILKRSLEEKGLFTIAEYEHIYDSLKIIEKAYE